MSAKPQVSIIVPVRTATRHLKETITHLKKQSFRDFELIVVTDQAEKITGAKVIASGEPGPAQKRNLGAQKAQGKILAFLDDDSYPTKNWLKSALRLFRSQQVAAVCGPCLTPSKDNLRQQASGWVWASWLGSAGAGVYRNRVSPRRKVDDFPSVNLLVRNKDFQKVGGFDISHWPGEDTKLCLDLTKTLGKKIIYDPEVLVYHHRREIFGSHLTQIGRYAIRRGFFAKKFPETSMRLGYWSPTLFVLGLIGGGLLALVSPLARLIYLVTLAFYLGLIILTGLEVFFKTKNIFLTLLVMLAIFATHVYYGLLFPVGFFQKDLGVIPHSVDKKKQEYIGG